LAYTPNRPLSLDVPDIQLEEPLDEGKNTQSGRKYTCQSSQIDRYLAKLQSPVFGRNRTTWGRRGTFQATRLNSISNGQNTFSGAYGLPPRGQVVRDAEGVSSSRKSKISGRLRGTRPAPPV